jgi:hypothetical protein
VSVPDASRRYPPEWRTERYEIRRSSPALS